jgi:hypothetical protein
MGTPRCANYIPNVVPEQKRKQSLQTMSSLAERSARVELFVNWVSHRRGGDRFFKLMVGLN